MCRDHASRDEFYRFRTRQSPKLRHRWCANEGSVPHDLRLRRHAGTLHRACYGDRVRWLGSIERAEHFARSSPTGFALAANACEPIPCWGGSTERRWGELRDSRILNLPIRSVDSVAPPDEPLFSAIRQRFQARFIRRPVEGRVVLKIKGRELGIADSIAFVGDPHRGLFGRNCIVRKLGQSTCRWCWRT